MKTILGSAVFALTLLDAAVPAFAQDAYQPVEEYTPPPPPQVAPTGEWIDTDAYGQIWVPSNTATVIVQQRPYAYFYTPAYGWTWYVSPWGPGIYRRGPWVHAVIAPHVYYHRGWVVYPHARYTYRPAVVYRAPARHVIIAHPHHRR